MHDFTFHAPDSLAGALELLAEHDGDAKLLAGGTSLTTLLKQSLIAPDHVVSLHRVPGLDSIAVADGELRIGGLTTQRDVETSAVVKEHAPLLAEAYRRVATVRIRNVATVGGGIAQADPAMDPPPSLLILGASVVATSTRGERVIPISEVYADYYETTLEPDEIVTELRVPAQPSGAGWTYIKYLPGPRTTTPPSPSPPSAASRAAASPTCALRSEPSRRPPCAPRSSRRRLQARPRRSTRCARPRRPSPTSSTPPTTRAARPGTSGICP